MSNVKLTASIWSFQWCQWFAHEDNDHVIMAWQIKMSCIWNVVKCWWCCYSFNWNSTAVRTYKCLYCMVEHLLRPHQTDYLFYGFWSLKLGSVVFASCYQEKFAKDSTFIILGKKEFCLLYQFQYVYWPPLSYASACLICKYVVSLKRQGWGHSFDKFWGR